MNSVYWKLRFFSFKVLLHQMAKSVVAWGNKFGSIFPPFLSIKKQCKHLAKPGLNDYIYKGIGIYKARESNVTLILLSVTQDGCTDVTNYERKERRKYMTFYPHSNWHSGYLVHSRC